MSNYCLRLLDASKPLLNYHRPSLLLGFFIATLSTPVFAWQSLGDGVNNFVYALKFDNNGNLIASGNFTTADGLNTGVIAKWDGNSWTSLGTGLSGMALTLTTNNSGHIFAGGSVSIDNGITYGGVAEWDGTNWSAHGPYTNSLIFALSTDSNNNLLAGYHFPYDTPLSDSVIQWNGSAWTTLAGAEGGPVRTLIKNISGNIIAGGDFTSIAGVNTNDIAQWDGTNWSSVGSGANSLSNVVQINASTLDNNNNLIVGGYFNNSSGESINPIAKWNGSTWSSVGTLADGIAYSLTADKNSNLYAGGSFHIESSGLGTEIVRWNGSRWVELGRMTAGGTGAVIQALATDTSGNLYAGGTFTGAYSDPMGGGGVPVGRIAVYVYQDIPANQWRMISLPHVPITGTTLQDSALFGDDLTPANYGSVWVVYERNEATKTYRKLALTDPLVQGKGYWIYSTTDATLDMDGTATPLVTTNPNCTSSKGCYEVTLTSPVSGETKRQSLIGFPFFRPTSWADVRFEVDGFAYSPSEAAASNNNFAAKTLWKYNGSSYETYDDVTPGLTGKLAKMEGFWVRLLPGSIGKNVKLLIPLS